MVVDTVHNELIVDSINNSIRVFSRMASGDAVPLRTIQGANTKLNNPVSIAFDAVADELFVDSYDIAGPNLPGFLVFNRTDSGNVAPKRFVSGASTQFGTFTNYVTVDRTDGELFAQGDNGLGIVVFNLTDNGNVAPKRNLTGSSTGISSIGGIIVDHANNRLIASNQPGGGGDSLRAFPRTATGNTASLLAVSRSGDRPFNPVWPRARRRRWPDRRGRPGSSRIDDGRSSRTWVDDGADRRCCRSTAVVTTTAI